MTYDIPYNNVFLTGQELKYVQEVLQSGRLAGNGLVSRWCHDFFRGLLNCEKALLTTSCTDALEMSAILANIEPGDEVIIPSFTFVSTANAFALRGAKILFADSMASNPNIDVECVSDMMSDKTKVIVPVHYAGIACDMNKIMELAKSRNVLVVEDAAQAIDSYYKGKPLGSLGHLSCFSFHATKNLVSGEGGMLCVNDKSLGERAEVIWEKGTNRSKFLRGEVDKYSWVDVGSSFLPSEITAAVLKAQLESIEAIQNYRKSIWSRYHVNLSDLEDQGLLQRPIIPEYATYNGHIYYIILENDAVRRELIQYLANSGIESVTHFLPLDQSVMGKKYNSRASSPNSEKFATCLLRLPINAVISIEECDKVSEEIHSFFTKC